MKISIYAIPGIQITSKSNVINNAVSQVFEIPKESMMERTRKREVVEPRQVAMYFHKKYTKYGVNSIGKLFGGYHHATVLHACKTVESLCQVDKIFANKVRLVKLLIV
jgi:chromosomal replication initiator protein